MGRSSVKFPLEIKVGNRYEGRYLKLAYKTLLDRAVLRVLKDNPYKLRAGGIVKLLHGRGLQSRNCYVPDFFRLANHVRDSLHRLELEGLAAHVNGSKNGAKRWSLGRAELESYT